MAGNIEIDVGGLAESLMEGLDELFTSDEERLAYKDRIEKRLHERLNAQVELNKEEAKHASVFVAGWRPALGWVCTLGIGMQFILRPVFIYINQCISMFLGTTVPVPPSLEVEQLMSLIVGMLGLAGYRTYEKQRGVPDSVVRILTNMKK